MNNSKLRMASPLVLGLMVIFTMPSCRGLTDPRDVFSINFLYLDLGTPPLPGWKIDGDPCFEEWQGVQCVDSNITAIILNGSNLGGVIGESIGSFASIITIDLSNNHIGGRIPMRLPVTLRRLFLSGNNFTGPLPSSLSSLTLLTDMSVNNNLLLGYLPDAFLFLTGVINLDLSSNNFSGQLPLSMGNLSSLTTLYMENNHLSGTLDILQDLPLIDLNIENNLFSGPIPGKLLTIPIFRSDGNPFNTTLPSSSPPASAPSPLSVGPAPTPDGPSDILIPEKNKGNSTTRVIILAAIALTALIVAALILIICLSKLRRKLKDEEATEVTKHEKLKKPVSDANLVIPITNIKKNGPKEKVEKQLNHEIDMWRTDVVMMPPLAEKIIVEPTTIPPKKIKSAAAQSSVSSFSVASLQQYTNSFIVENLISKDSLSKVYLAELPDGKRLRVVKLDNVIKKIPADKFIELVSIISELRHPNILELVGYCAEFEQRLLVYSYFSRRTLHDILHGEDEFKKKLSWNARVKVALGAAGALEYLHEGCRAPIMHKNFDSMKILLDDGPDVRVSNCGLASLMISNSPGQIRTLPNHEAPEFDDPESYTEKSDVYSFGVVMLELLTGRKPYESSRPREQRYLVKWASSQLYDINALSRMVDPSIDGNLPMKSLSRFADIINRCIAQQPEFRPPMSEVVQDLIRMIEDARTNANRTPTNLL